MLSHGVGIEIQHSLTRGIPVLGIATDKADISRMVLGHLTLKGGVKRYRKLNDIPGLVFAMLRGEIKAVGRHQAHLIAVEGPDFVGKSELIPVLANHVERVTGTRPQVTTDPPWKLAPWGELQAIFKKDERLSKRAEALLYVTARVDNYRRNILPFLTSGGIVIADRFIDSWLAYQSVRMANEPRDRPRELEFLLAQEMLLESFGGIELPGLSLLLMADLDELFRRAESRPERDRKYEMRDFIAQVIEVYEDLYTRYPHRIVRIETTGRSKEEVKAIAAAVVSDYLHFHGLLKPD